MLLRAVLNIGPSLHLTLQWFNLACLIYFVVWPTKLALLPNFHNSLKNEFIANTETKPKL
jgi:hypothetical protein